MKDGIFEEHWDVIQDEATREQSKSRLPMFGDEFPKERLGAGRNLGANRACTSKLGRRRLMKLKAGELSFNVLESGSGDQRYCVFTTGVDRHAPGTPSLRNFRPISGASLTTNVAGANRSHRSRDTRFEIWPWMPSTSLKRYTCADTLWWAILWEERLFSLWHHNGRRGRRDLV